MENISDKRQSNRMITSSLGGLSRFGSEGEGNDSALSRRGS